MLEETGIPSLDDNDIQKYTQLVIDEIETKKKKMNVTNDVNQILMTRIVEVNSDRSLQREMCQPKNDKCFSTGMSGSVVQLITGRSVRKMNHK